ncbi:hypothetical protein BAUCODRAFT_161022 [Baudoinia panamericana UAMH 10762]|uniref:Ubiquitin-like protease family profile domain-containing protein n=1 Tax=Baudoinia panamericana (strain UAMH 10762) TaxID=717646 RepID=M2MI23_BAUPA|nr:uncharacterized protein BAUCODRAFT_161022 [Baudoinia panamericana UAMH 10762]EMC90913.1 hypothetical protein BAUCODRAFT_161022 [Baudoinia panamericana UAMH 10762]
MDEAQHYVSFYDISIDRIDLHSLSDCYGWLTDNAIAFGQAWLEHPRNATLAASCASIKVDPLPENILLIAPTVARVLQAADLSELDELIPDLKLTCTHILVPVNSKAVHWALLLVSVTNHTSWLYDPAGGVFSSSTASDISTHLSHLLRSKSMGTHGLDFARLPASEVPQQQKSHDCGILVVACKWHHSERIRQTNINKTVNVALGDVLVDPWEWRLALVRMMRALRAEGRLKPKFG